MVQGVQQPYEISVVSGLNEKLNNINISVFPNPTADFLILKAVKLNNESFAYQIFDISGKLIESRNIVSNETSISMNNFISSTYFLKVTIKNKIVKTFKIIKK